MISFKAFINAIHGAIMNASDSLMAKNEGLLDQYFEKSTNGEEAKEQEVLRPKMVILEYKTFTEPDQLKRQEVVTEQVQVPLITLVPLQMSQIEKAVLKADFEISVENEEVQLHFPNKKSGGVFKKKPETTFGQLEITMSPVESSEGLKLIVEGYESMLRRQID